MKVMCVFGTRPECIKMAPVVETLRDDARFELSVCVTAQHREMLDQVLATFGVVPDFDLDLMKKGQTLNQLTGRILDSLGKVLELARPHVVLVHGDTTTTAASALAAYHAQIPVGHVEAGLRTGNIYSPWPEEMNRRIAGAISTVHFAPTESARTNLINEGVNESAVCVSGNTVVDALLNSVSRIKVSGFNEQAAKKRLGIPKDKRIILVTGHRRESFGEGFKNICNALKRISNRPDVHIVYPVHLNPNVRAPVSSILGDAQNVTLIEPLEYIAFIQLMMLSSVILTDSGGIQEEAPSLGKPVLVLRQTTERPEAISAGTVKLVGTDPLQIESETNLLLDSADAYERMAKAHNPYGDGVASRRIADFLHSHFQSNIGLQT